MKKTYLAGGWLFPTKDLAIICANEPNPLELNVPIETKTIDGKIHIEYNHDNTIQLELIMEGSFDPSDIADYIPIVEYDVSKRGNTYNHTMSDQCNFKFSQLSESLQELIIEKADEMQEKESKINNEPWLD